MVYRMSIPVSNRNSLISFVGFVLYFVQTTHSTSHGAPSSSCFDMTPKHPNATEQASLPPYHISAVWSPDVSGAVEVTLSAKTERDLFQGYMVMAHMEGMEQHKVGKFFSTSDGRLLDCNDYGPEMAATHANAVEKNSVKVIWVPDGFEGDVIFRATFAKDMQTYWTKVDSSPFNSKQNNSGVILTSIATLMLASSVASLMVF